MSWMSPNMKMETTSNGGIGKALGRMFAGEALFQNRYTAQGGNGMIAFASSFPGQIRPWQIGPGNEVIVQKSGFLAAEEGVGVSAGNGGGKASVGVAAQGFVIGVQAAQEAGHKRAQNTPLFLGKVDHIAGPEGADLAFAHSQLGRFHILGLQTAGYHRGPGENDLGGADALGGQALRRLGAVKDMAYPDAVEKVAGGLAGIVVAQVDRQADGHRAAAFQLGGLGVDGQHQPATPGEVPQYHSALLTPLLLLTMTRVGGIDGIGGKCL